MTHAGEVEVVLALPNQCWRRRVALTAGMTAGDALRISGLGERYRERVGAGEPPIGLFGRKIRADQPLRDGDRLELYRPLTADPRQRRRARVDARRREGRSAPR